MNLAIECLGPGDLGQYLVERLVKISWQLDRADAFEQAELTKRIQDVPRLFAKSHAEPAETLFARLLVTEARPAPREPVDSPSARRLKRAEKRGQAKGAARVLALGSGTTRRGREVDSRFLRFGRA